MMKKNGFTLAEVLITLAIIGVVATLTLPALMNNAQEQQARTALKKGINTLTEAAQMNSAIGGFAYDGITSDAIDDATTQSLFGLLRNRVAVDLTAVRPQGEDPNGLTEVVFKDGTSLIFDPATTLATNDNTQLMGDGFATGFVAVLDTNGVRRPNQLSNCNGETLNLNALDLNYNDSRVAGGADADADAEQDEQANVEPVTQDQALAACTGANTNRRMIRDQFLIRLRGTYVQPEGNAATWAMIN